MFTIPPHRVNSEFRFLSGHIFDRDGSSEWSGWIPDPCYSKKVHVDSLDTMKTTGFEKEKNLDSDGQIAVARLKEKTPKTAKYVSPNQTNSRQET